MLNVDRVWARVSQFPDFRGRKLTEFGFQAVVLKYEGLAGTADADNVPLQFPNGAIILGITAGAFVESLAGTTVTQGGLNLFKVKLDFQQNRTIVGPNKAIASSVFGTGEFDMFPLKEIVVPTNGQLIYGFTGTTSSTIDITVTHHCLVPVNVG